jgi:hypothetical protein
VRHDRHHVDVVMVQEVEAAESEQHRTEERGGHAQPQAAEHPPRSRERRRIACNHFHVERLSERKKAVEELVKGVEEPALPFAMQMEAGEDRRSPEHGIAGTQRLVIEVADRQVKP